MDCEEITTIQVPTEQAEFLTNISKAIKEGDRTSLESHIRISRQAANTRKMLVSMEQGTYEEPVYMKKDEIDTAYQHVLDAEEPPSVDECYEVVIEKHGVSEEYLEETKSKPNKHLRSVIQENISHPKVKQMEINNVFDIEGLNKSTTPNQLLVNITNRRSVSDRLDTLESKVESLELRTSITEARQDSTDTALVDIINTKDHKQRIAKGLRDRGVKIKDIASTLEVDQRTVKRWLSSLKEASPFSEK